MPPRVHSTFRRLEQRLQARFGGDDVIWWPAAPGQTAYTVAIPCRQTEERGDARDMAGMLAMDTGTITLHALKEAFPFEPDENMCFLYGPPSAEDPAAPAATARKFQITSVAGPEMFAHFTLSARRH